MDVTAIIVAASIPSALTGFFFWLIEQRIQKRADKEKAEREERQKEVEADLERAIRKGRSGGLSDEELREMFTCILEDPQV